MYPRNEGKAVEAEEQFTAPARCVWVLLAAPAIVMALITDLGNNTSPTIQSEKADIADQRQPAWPR